MRMDNTRMLEILRQTNPVLHYNLGKDIALAGEDYKVVAAAVFVKDPADPLTDYITVKVYDDALGFILVGVSTREEALLEEAAAYVAEIGGHTGEIELRTTYPEILDSPALLDRFTLEEPAEFSMNPVYYVHTADELIDHPLTEGLTVVLADDRERERARALLSGADGDENELREGLLYLPDNLPDIRQLILYDNCKPVGYVRGENGFANIYDIGWIQILPRCRGRGYGKQLTAYFSRYCFKNGLVPQYGFAINEASAAVAEACGYRCDTEKRVAKLLVLKK